MIELGKGYFTGIVAIYAIFRPMIPVNVKFVYMTPLIWEIQLMENYFRHNT